MIEMRNASEEGDLPVAMDEEDVLKYCNEMKSFTLKKDMKELSLRGKYFYFFLFFY